jgi:hypothetical protein
LGPFAGCALSEREERILAAASGQETGVEPLITTSHGAPFVRVRTQERLVFVSFAPVADIDQDESAARFDGRDFMGVLPLMVFARHALHKRAWRSPHPRAAFLIDDPNLRARRYGFVDYRRLVADGRRHRFHTALAMIPLDHRKTREPAARLFRSHPEQLSLVVHGVDHVHHEFGRSVTRPVAEAVLAERLQRVRDHDRRWEVVWDRVMTFPFGRSTPIWLNAMHRVGFDAAVVSCISPPAQAEIVRDPPYHLYPADLVRQSLPVLTRQPLENPREDLLFEAWLGKPIIVTTHHDALRGGTDRLIDLADYVNRHIDPDWGSIGTIVAANYQWRPERGGIALRVFSNRVTVHEAATVPIVAALKPCPVGEADERAWANGNTVPIETIPGVGIVARDIGHGRPVQLAFGSAEAGRHPARADHVRHSSARRLITEARDQVVGTPPARWMFRAADRYSARRGR